MKPHTFAVTRRTACGLGLATLATPALPAWATSGTRALVVVEGDGPAARHAHAAATTLALPVFATTGDIAPLWQARLRPHWQHGAAPTIGLTSLHALFAIEMLARDVGQVLVHHEPLAPDALPDLAALLARTGPRQDLHALPAHPQSVLWAIRPRNREPRA